jgi:RNA polymerase sigma-54 factor
MKQGLHARLGQTINLTPQLLQSIRLLQLTAPQLEQELRQALERNPMLEYDEHDEAGETEADAHDAACDDAAREAAAWDDLPEPAFLSGTRSACGNDDATARIAAGLSSDPRVRLLDTLALRWNAHDLALAGWWLDHCDDHGLLESPLSGLHAQGAQALGVDAAELEQVRQRLLHGECAGVAAADAGECLLAQLAELPADTTRALAEHILREHITLLAAHDHDALAAALGVDAAAVEAAVARILGLRPTPFEDTISVDDGIIIPDAVAWRAGDGWRVALNDRATPQVRVAAHCERALAQAPGDNTVLRGMLEEARWLVRGVAMRNDTLLRTVQVLIARQQGFLERGEEALSPLTLREVADAIGMHESTVSRITSGKYLQTPRGTIELKKLFVVRLDGAEVGGAAVRAMVKRLIEAEPAHAPLADDTIAGLLARKGVRIARRTVAKYRDQLAIAPARARQRRVPAAMEIAS